MAKDKPETSGMTINVTKEERERVNQAMENTGRTRKSLIFHGIKLAIEQLEGK